MTTEGFQRSFFSGETSQEYVNEPETDTGDLQEVVYTDHLSSSSKFQAEVQEKCKIALL